MTKLIFLVFVAIIGVIFFVIKSSVGKITGSENLRNTTFKGETKKVMDKTASGIGWMNEQWEKSKKDAKNQK